MLIKTVVDIGNREPSFFINDQTGSFIAVSIMLHQVKGVAVYFNVINGMPGTNMPGNSQTGGFHIYLKVFLLFCFLLLLLAGDHGNGNNPVTQFNKLLRLGK